MCTSKEPVVQFPLTSVCVCVQAICSESKSCPFILFIKDAEKSIAANSDSYSAFKTRLDKLPSNVVVIGSHTQSDSRKEKVIVCLLSMFISSQSICIS